MISTERIVMVIICARTGRSWAGKGMVPQTTVDGSKIEVVREDERHPCPYSARSKSHAQWNGAEDRSCHNDP